MFSIDFVHSIEEQEKFISTLESQGWIINLIQTLDYGRKYSAIQNDKECRFVIYNKKGNHSTKLVAEKHTDDFKAIIEKVESALSHSVVLKKDENRYISYETKEIPSYKSRIGSDESGKGDYFGPLVVTAVYLTKEDEALIEDLNISDSKAHNDNVNLRTKNKLIEILDKSKYSIKILSPSEFNKIFKLIKNTNVILANLHREAITELLVKNPECKNVIVDQFAKEEFVLNSFKRANMLCVEILQTPKAERDKAVAAASMIARGVFLEEREKLCEKYKLDLPLGAGANVDNIASCIIKKYGIEALDDCAKVNFKNTEKARLLV